MVEFWKMMRLFLGFGAPRREQQVTVQEAPGPAAIARGPADACWAMGVHIVLPGPAAF